MFKNRGETKDAYDLFYVINHYHSFDEIVSGFRALLKGEGDRCAIAALATLNDDFKSPSSIGCMRAAEFFLGDTKEGRDEFYADVSGVIMRFARAVAKL